MIERRAFLTGAASLAASTALSLTSTASHAGSRTLFMRSAVENADITATLPLYRGTSQGRTVWFILLDSSSGDDADRLGINRSQKLELYYFLRLNRAVEEKLVNLYRQGRVVGGTGIGLARTRSTGTSAERAR